MEQKCSRPECSGTIIEDVCEDCGRAPPGQSLVAKFAANWKSTLANVKPISKQETKKLIAELSTEASTEIDETAAAARSLAKERRGTAQTRALGAGLVAIDPLSKIDPEKLILTDTTVPESKRLCGHCGMQFHYMKGFCPKCGREYSLVPTLNAGHTVAGQYEIKGPIAFGGLGWIYLAWDRLLSRFVVLKGLLNSKDEVSAAQALQERRYLAAVKHANIVGIYNFVSHGREGFIVMEFVSGQTIKQIRQARGPLPVAEAIAYVHRILSAFAHLHKMGLVYCDFKPDNFMFEDDDVKLIDMGGVARIDDSSADIYCTKGYAAPEAMERPTVASDLYTIARTLAVLVINFKFQSEFEFSLPDPAQEPLFRKFDSLYRFLVKATRKEPKDRFQSADTMADQLLGILRETAAEEYTRSVIESTNFEHEEMHLHSDSDGISLNAVPHGEKAFRLLPALRIDLTDSAANDIARLKAVKEPNRIQRLLESATSHHPDSIEARLRLADLKAQSKIFSVAENILNELEKAHPRDWRVKWYRGKWLLMRECPVDAHKLFDIVYSEIPGEFAPKLALAICAELEHETETAHATRTRATAKKLYQTVARADHTNSPAIFGLARCLLKENNRAGAVEALRKVPPTSSHYVYAQMAIARALIRPLNYLPEQQDLVQASIIIEAMDSEGFEKHRLAADTLLVAIQLAAWEKFKPAPDLVLGCVMYPRRLREAAERQLRLCAKYAPTERMRCQLVDEANEIRPMTII
ncbi:serine/threonine-protein kinase [soil metagenome]